MLCNVNAARERFKSTYLTKHFKNCIRMVSKSVKEILEKYRNRQKRLIKQFIFSKVVGWRLAVLLIMISFLFIFHGIWFNCKLFLIAFKHLFSERHPVTANDSFTRSVVFKNVRPPTITCWLWSTASTWYKMKIITTF